MEPEFFLHSASCSCSISTLHYFRAGSGPLAVRAIPDCQRAGWVGAHSRLAAVSPRATVPGYRRSVGLTAGPASRGGTGRLPAASRVIWTRIGRRVGGKAGWGQRVARTPRCDDSELVAAWCFQVAVARPHAIRPVGSAGRAHVPVRPSGWAGCYCRHRPPSPPADLSFRILLNFELNHRRFIALT